MHIRDHFLSLAIILLIATAAVNAYIRFFVEHDYVVAYEGACEPETEDCFVGCEDDACTSVYYYTKVRKYAADLFAECGPDITECEEANRCIPSRDSYCSIAYCDPAENGEECESFSGSMTVPDDTAEPGFDSPGDAKTAPEDGAPEQL